MSYSIASYCHIGLHGLDLALCTKIQACIYICIGSALRASLYIGLYTCVWAIYAQSKPCIHIYGSYIYVFCLHLVVNMHFVICIYHFGILQACRPTSLLPPMRRVTLDSLQKNSLSATVQGWSSLATWLRHVLCFVWSVTAYIYAHICMQTSYFCTKMP